MGIYGNIVNEELLIESILLESEISKEDLQDKDKVLKVIKKKEKEKGPLQTITFVLQIIGLVIITLLAGITSPIWFPLLLIITDLIGKVEESKKNKAIDQVVNNYKKQITKLKKNLDKEMDPSKRKQIQETINQLEEEIKIVENKRIDEKYIKKIEDGLDRLKGVLESPTPDFENPNELSLYLFYKNIDQKYFDSLYKNKKNYYDDILDYVREEDNKELYDYFNKYKGDRYIFFTLIDDTIFIYNIDKGIFFYGDWDVKYIKSYKFDQFKNNYKEFNSDCWENIVSADAYLGYYRLSKAPNGVTPKELPKSTK